MPPASQNLPAAVTTAPVAASQPGHLYNPQLEPAAYASVPVLPLKPMSNGIGINSHQHQQQHHHPQQQQQQHLHHPHHQNQNQNQNQNKRKFSTFF
ncbi:ecdysone-induced protein 74EF-like [Drosophila serrata]|uniref:ecdysone-induced protein 74EF-like n=1 Tax=Drosophila serrata TaxID=7274 RepID=UPI000A1D2239|nr:ecdysone-induced protein 74EF-like [Drosophila serrata]